VEIEIRQINKEIMDGKGEFSIPLGQETDMTARLFLIWAMAGKSESKPLFERRAGNGPFTDVKHGTDIMPSPAEASTRVSCGIMEGKPALVLL
jgi:hypothetical protein